MLNGGLYAAGTTVQLSVNGDGSPYTVTLPRIGWPGLRDLKCELSGIHSYINPPALPKDVMSETARELVYSTKNINLLAPHLSGNSPANSYDFSDFVVLPHTTLLLPGTFVPAIDGICRIGFSFDSPLWQRYHLATFCQEIHKLYLEPKRVTSCLSTRLADLSCLNTGPFWCPTANAVVKINHVLSNITVIFSPLDHFILGNAQDSECAALKSRAYTDGSIRIQIGEWKFERTGESLIGTQAKSGAQILDDVFQCNHANVPPNTLIVGLMGSDYSWHLDNRTLHIHKSQSTTMLNTWWDVVIINVCLLAYMHYLSDRRKDPTKIVTLIPELLGSACALAGVYRQIQEGGAYDRVMDYEYGKEAPIMLTWAILATSAAHLSALILEYEDHATTSRGTLLKIRAARNLSYEYAILASVFMQVVTGYAETYQNYM